MSDITDDTSTSIYDVGALFYNVSDFEYSISGNTKNFNIFGIEYDSTTNDVSECYNFDNSENSNSFELIKPAQYNGQDHSLYNNVDFSYIKDLTSADSTIVLDTDIVFDGVDLHLISSISSMQVAEVVINKRSFDFNIIYDHGYALAESSKLRIDNSLVFNLKVDMLDLASSKSTHNQLKSAIGTNNNVLREQYFGVYDEMNEVELFDPAFKNIADTISVNYNGNKSNTNITLDTIGLERGNSEYLTYCLILDASFDTIMNHTLCYFNDDINVSITSSNNRTLSSPTYSLNTSGDIEYYDDSKTMPLIRWHYDDTDDYITFTTNYYNTIFSSISTDIDTITMCPTSRLSLKYEDNFRNGSFMKFGRFNTVEYLAKPTVPKGTEGEGGEGFEFIENGTPDSIISIINI